MKIALARRGYSPTGGAEAYCQRFADAAVAAGHEVVLLTEQWPRSAWLYEHVQVPSRSPRRFADALFALRARAGCDYLFSLERIWTCDGYRAGDGVHAQWLERRALFEPWWKAFFRGFSRKHKETLALERHLFSRGGAAQIIANSNLIKQEIVRRFSYPEENIRVVYNGVPAYHPPPDARAATRRELGFRDEDYVLLFAGSGWERKGLRFAIEAVKSLSHSARLVVAGRGSPRGMPASHRVKYLGPVREMARYLAAADAFILPTLYEPFSNACLEALAAGLPVITTRHNGFAEIIAEGVEGEVVADPRDIGALGRAIEAWRSPGKRADSRNSLQRLGARFTMAENVRQTLEVISAGRG